MNLSESEASALNGPSRTQHKRPTSCLSVFRMVLVAKERPYQDEEYQFRQVIRHGFNPLDHDGATCQHDASQASRTRKHVSSRTSAGCVEERQDQSLMPYLNSLAVLRCSLRAACEAPWCSRGRTEKRALLAKKLGDMQNR